MLRRSEFLDLRSAEDNNKNGFIKAVWVIGAKRLKYNQLIGNE